MKASKIGLVLLGLALLAGCSGLPHPAGQPLCEVEGSPAPALVKDTAALRHTIEASRLYKVPADAEGLAACRIRYPDGLALQVEYRFNRGGSLWVKRDPRIEYTELDARYRLPPGVAAKDLLVDAEQSLFGQSGCGIEWRDPETRPADGEPGVTETIYRGEVCNCQGRVRTDADGQIVGLSFRSAC